ncbi:hypothetical protein GCM10009743_56090 [Kribbella swartbergensis]
MGWQEARGGGAVETAGVQIRAKQFIMRPRWLTGRERQVVWADLSLAGDPRLGRLGRKSNAPSRWPFWKPVES